VTSTAEPVREGSGGSWFRVLLLLGVLLLLSWQLPTPWGTLWLIVPGTVAISLLTAWRFGAWGVTVPLGLFGAALLFEGPMSLWAWWIPVAALTGTWMGLREEAGGPASGQRAWMLLPLLLLAAALPWMLSYPSLVTRVDEAMQRSNQNMMALVFPSEAKSERTATLRQTWADTAVAQRQSLPFLLPSGLFLWMTLLVGVGRGLSARVARLMRWPELSHGRRRDWRLPDGAVWVLIGGLAVLLSPWPDWKPTGWTLLLGAGLGYCVQGIAVVESLLLARGVPPSMILLTLLFVFAMATPVFLLAATAVGVSDLWLDYRRLEAVPDGD
jgi:hypothetical protein